MEIVNSAYDILNTPFFKLGDVPITMMVIVQTIAVLVASVIVSRLVQRALRTKVLQTSRIGQGTQASISRVVHYIIVSIGVMVAVDNVGIDLSTLATISAVLMVGIGFGLQNITSNFISGLILLFERPIQVGDFVEVSGVLGTVKAIKARSTTVDTLDNVSIIVPNANFVQENVTNWSYQDTTTRIRIVVGVSYSSDVDLVRDTLIEVARAHPTIMESPEPNVQFRSFGDSTLDFHLLAWIQDPKKMYNTQSDLNFAVIKAFRAKKIEIAFPQRDLHLRSADVFPVRIEGDR
jgi:potassium efflux system protein